MSYNRVTERLARAAYGEQDVYCEVSDQENRRAKPNFEISFLDSLVEGIIILDCHRHICAVNPALEQMLGWRTGELLGRSCQEVLGCKFSGTDISLCQNFCPLLKLKQTSSVTRTARVAQYQELAIATASGERLEVSASLVPFSMTSILPPLNQNKEETETLPLEFAAPSETPDYYSIMILRDITEQKRQERIQIEFITNASHQLRTPLTSLKTSIELLLGSVGVNFNPPLLRLLQNIQVSSQQIERLVKDLIELTRLQSGRVQLQIRQIAASEIINRVITSSSAHLEAKQQLLEVESPAEPLYIEVDLGRISQVFEYLISNASKFSPPLSRIKLRVRAARGAQKRQEVIFSVQDEGIGIPAEEQGQIFEKYYQSQMAENTTNGLGLPLAKALVELNGGRLWFESEPGRGSIFFFAFPAIPPSM
jgi:signal transduction histidine kinase